MSRVYVIADLHFGHKKLEEIRGINVAEQIERWNSVVEKRDVVYVLGDVFKIDQVPLLRGMKKLILGNHDQLSLARYLECFTSVHAMSEFDGCLLTHIPVHPNQKHRYRKNIHGHMHDKVVMTPVFDEFTWHPDQPDPFYVCVSSERLQHTPVLLRELTK